MPAQPMQTAPTRLPGISFELAVAMSDDLLVQHSLDGDQVAFSCLVERYKRPVFSLAYRHLGNRHDAEDAAQETFVRAYTRLASYQTGSRFGSWLLAITAHWCIDFLRRQRTVSLDAHPHDPTSGVPTSDHPEVLALDAEQAREVRQILASLPAPYQTVLVLRYWQDLSYAEMSQATGLPLSTIRMRLFRARQLLSASCRAVVPHALAGIS